MITFAILNLETRFYPDYFDRTLVAAIAVKIDTSLKKNSPVPKNTVTD